MPVSVSLSVAKPPVLYAVLAETAFLSGVAPVPLSETLIVWELMSNRAVPANESVMNAP